MRSEGDSKIGGQAGINTPTKRTTPKTRPNDYIFSLDPYGSENDVGDEDGCESSDVFDIRTLKTYNAEENIYKNLLKAIDEGVLGENNLLEREAGVDEYADVNDGASEHHCPVCDANLLTNDENAWGGSELTGDGTHYEYECTCPQCGAEFHQVYCLVFDGYDIM